MTKNKKKSISKFIHSSILFLVALLIIPIFSSWYLPAAETYMPVNLSTLIEIKDANKKPFFPFGFYFLSMNPQQRIKALHEIAAAGFNTMFVFWENLDEYGTFLDEAKRIGVHIITELKHHSNLGIVNEYKDKSAILAWGIADDAGDRNSSDEILAFHQEVKAIDPQHYTYVSISNWTKKWEKYSHVADLIGGQSYPIGYPFDNKPKNLPNDLSEVSYVFNLGYAETQKNNRPVIANLQTFSWKGQRWPTASEVYNMTYQALIAGVKGILFYTYDDDENFIRDHPDIWNQVKSITPEIKKLTPVLLEGNLTKINTKFDDLLAGQWIHDSGIYLILINTSNRETRQVALKIPAKAKGPAQALFSGRPSGMVFQDGNLSGLIKAGDVHIYKLSKE
ncbi:hypothetical protein [Cylindrospermum sp. FACHB-282]|uniref:hypothetical protein n=1 Tax=Cylindrospermum sp. FACHB-282 TaxID=2692794 RepID=UPI0016889EA2|nr:hypothetical protein [Cylindrospermum sp. FACHB-282]MBD2387483.1 hypothetical protein [Cylindrospermum sp. FACHB-282]